MLISAAVTMKRRPLKVLLGKPILRTACFATVATITTIAVVAVVVAVVVVVVAVAAAVAVGFDVRPVAVL